MSTTGVHADLNETTRSCVTELVCKKCDVKRPITDTEAFCPTCGKCLDVAYDYELARTRLRELSMADRPSNIWRLSELLPIRSSHAQAEVGQVSGMTPLIPANRLGAKLGLSKLYLKDDSTQRPSLSYKDRVVSTAIARALELGKHEIGCVSTGNVGTAVAALAAKAGLTPYVFYPERLEETKARACRALGARVCQVAGNYDEAYRECRKVAAASGLEFANITLRPF
jgi:threonine synthase